MNIFSSVSGVLSYLFDGIVELFSPDHDNYPPIGVQPFDGEAYSKWVSITGYKYRSR